MSAYNISLEKSLRFYYDFYARFYYGFYTNGTNLISANSDAETY